MLEKLIFPWVRRYFFSFTFEDGKLIIIFSLGTWIGLELISENGKNDGSIQGIRYFECEKKHGIFVRPNKLLTSSGMNWKR